VDDGEDGTPIRCSLGITAYDEEANIGRLLEAVLSQRTRRVILTEVVVVASGCTDATVAIARGWEARDPRVCVLVQPTREGKASAVNLFLARAREHVLVLCSADLIPGPDVVEQVVTPFADPAIGMTTCRPVPVNDPRTFTGFAAHMLWTLHHRMNLIAFKAGELIAFRKVFHQIPYRTSVDEACIEPVIRGQGYGVRYVGGAVTWNKGPDTVGEFLSQRRRIHAGHLALRDDVGYRVSTLSGLKVLGLVLSGLDWRPRAFVWTWAVAALEAYGRLLGKRDYRKGRAHPAWVVAKSTKRLGPVLAKAPGGSGA